MKNLHLIWKLKIEHFNWVCFWVFLNYGFTQTAKSYFSITQGYYIKQMLKQKLKP